jgi:hypothetical protein
MTYLSPYHAVDLETGSIIVYNDIFYTSGMHRLCPLNDSRYRDVKFAYRKGMNDEDRIKRISVINTIFGVK